MFTGIVEAMGEVAESSGAGLSVRCLLAGITVGDSLCINGGCLTVIQVEGDLLEFDLSEETRSRTTLGGLSRGDLVNLERPVRAGDRLGGHVVQGHVDGVGEVIAVQRKKKSVEMEISVAPPLRRYLAEKGSVAADGVSLTVSMLTPDSFWVSLVPHTLESTTLGRIEVGGRVNVEMDILAKYVESLMNADREVTA